MTPGFIQRLQQKWNLKNAGQVMIVLLVFACTGFSVMFLKKPITEWIYSDPEIDKTLFSILYWLLILPVYNLLLLFYGFLFGQFKFFWEFEKRFFSRFVGSRKLENPTK